MAAYAQGTRVPVERSLAQIRLLLLKAGATHYANGEGPDSGGVQFRLHDLHYRFEVKRPTWPDIEHRYSRGYRVDHDRALADEWNRRWRARWLWVKAMIEFAEIEPDAFAEAMLAHLVLPDGRTFGGWAAPQIATMYADGAMPPLLLGSGS
jgi:hypothetical protein